MRRPLLLLALLCSCAEPAPRVDPAPEEPSDAGVTPPRDGPAAPCARFAVARPLATVRADSLEELSGLAVSRRDPAVLWAIEDSGNEASVHALDRTGRRLGEVRLNDTQNVDFEDLALGPCPTGDCLFVADIGDNAEARTDLAILRLPEPAAVDGHATVERFAFRYPDGPQDAEALVVDPEGRPVILTKRRDGTTRLYRVPLVATGTAVAERIGALDVFDLADGLVSAVTAADLSADGTALYVRTYGSGFVFRLPTRDLAATDRAIRILLPVAVEPQGEALAFDPATGGALQVSEGTNAPIYVIDCAP